MNVLKLVMFASVVFALAACSSPQEDAAKANEDAARAEEMKTKRRLELIDQYQACMKEGEGNKEKQEICQSYLEASKALK